MRSMRRHPWLLLIGLLCISPAYAGTLSASLQALLRNSRARGPSSTAISRIEARNPLAPRLDAAGRVEVYARVRSGDTFPASSTLRSLGARAIHYSHALEVVQMWLPVSALPRLAALPGIQRVAVPSYVRLVVPPLTYMNLSNVVRSASVTSGLEIDAAAVSAMQADKLQSVGATGSGVKVGVISGGASGLSDSQNAGYLPANVWVDPDYTGSGSEGTAMLEIVHAMAPGAALGFCGPNTSVEFLSCYSDLAGWGANIIIDDLGFTNVDYFASNTTPGSMNSAVAQFTTQHPTIALVSAAGNDALDWYQAPYTGHAGQTINGTTYRSVMDFGAAIGQGNATELPVTFAPASITYIGVAQWNDPPGTEPDKFDLYLFDAAGNVIETPTSFTTDDGRPGSYFLYSPQTTTTDYLVLACATCTSSTGGYNPVTVKITTWGDAASTFQAPYDLSGSITPGQPVVPGVLAVAAAGVVSPSPLQIGVESYSGRGPYLYGDFGATATSDKPDLTGLDGVLVSGAGGFAGGGNGGGVIFCGTSAAAPNVGALIATLMQASPGQDASFYYNLLENTAAQGVFGYSYQGCGAQSSAGYDVDVTGAGLPQGYNALASFYNFPTSTISQPATSSITALAYQSVAFEATVLAGTNPGAPNSCQWSAVLQGGDKKLSASGGSVSLAFPRAGTYAVTVRCADTRGIESTSSSAAVDVIVSPAPSQSSGGGGLGPWALLALAGLLAVGAGGRAARRFGG